MQNSDATEIAPSRARDVVPAVHLTRSRAQWRSLAAGGVLAVAFAAAYWPTIRKMAEYWSTNDMYSYGFLIPVITGYLIWSRRARLRDIPVQPSFTLGSTVLAVGLGLLVIGRVSATNIVEEFSLPVSVSGVTLLVFGRELTRSIAFPLAYLFTMVPFWDILTGRLHLPFQLYSAAIGVSALRALDLPVLHNGTFIELPNITLEVAQVCSGVNNLVAVLCIGVPLTHYYVARWPKRLLIIGSAVLIALLSNGVRVAGVCLFAFYDIRGADGDIHGPYALLRSLFISSVGFIVLFWLISHFADRAHDQLTTDSPSRSPAAVMRTRLAAFGVALAMVVVSGTFQWWWPNGPVPLAAGLVDFPTTIGRWELGHDASLGEGLNSLDFDQKLVRGYSTADGEEVTLLLGYLSKQVQGRELAGQSMLAGTGLSGFWTARIPPAGGTVMKEFVANKGSERFYVVYVYILDGTVIAGDIDAKIRTTWNVLTERRSNGGVMLVAGKIGSDEEIGAAGRRVRDFVEEVMPQSAAYLAGSR
jgi:EpsI family protein